MSVTRSQELQHDDDLSARAKNSPGSSTKPDRLAAGQATPRLGDAGQRQLQQQPRVADILKRYAVDFVRDHRSAAVPQVQSTLAKLSLCRTLALGGHVYACRTCDHRVVVRNWCGDRHCPQCSGARRRDWLDSSAKLLLPGVTYYQVVFTIPDKLSSLTLGNRRAMFDLLFRSAWQALKQTIEDEQQFEAAATMVLHTWNQQLDAHVHVHALVPGGGPSLKNADQWKNARLPAHEAPSAHKTQNRFWLVDADALRLAFRTAFLGGLHRLHARSELKLDGEWSSLRNAAAFEEWLQPLENVKWVVYIQSPPTPDTTPDQVLKYLAGAFRRSRMELGFSRALESTMWGHLVLV